MIVYFFDDYKVLLKTYLLEKKAQFGELQYSFQRMANHCRIEKSYLSRTLNGDSHLNQDQLYLACDFLDFSEEERKYVFLLHQSARTGVEPYRQELKREIDRLRQQGEQTPLIRDAAPYSEDSKSARLFLDPNVSIVFEMLSIDKYKSDREAIAKDLHIRTEDVQDILATLEDLGYIANEQGRYEVKKRMMRLPTSSPYFRAYHSQMNARSLERIQRGGFQGSIHLRTFSASPKVFQTVVADLNRAISKADLAIGRSEADEVYQMNFQLFPWA